MSLINKLIRVQSLHNALIYLPVRCNGVKKKFNPDNVKVEKPANSGLRGFQVKDGDYVFKNDILVTQVGLEVYPGQNVCLHGEQWELRAMASGYAIITTEVISPFRDSPIYDVVASGKRVTKPFIHVLEDEPDHYFRVKEML